MVTPKLEQAASWTRGPGAGKRQKLVRDGEFGGLPIMPVIPSFRWCCHGNLCCKQTVLHCGQEFACRNTVWRDGIHLEQFEERWWECLPFFFFPPHCLFICKGELNGPKIRSISNCRESNSDTWGPKVGGRRWEALEPMHGQLPGTLTSPWRTLVQVSCQSRVPFPSPGHLTHLCVCVCLTWLLRQLMSFLKRCPVRSTMVGCFLGSLFMLSDFSL